MPVALLVRGWGVGAGSGSSVPLFVRASPVWGVRGLVGLLFEICIVDASIFTARLEACSGSSGTGCLGGVVSV